MNTEKITTAISFILKSQCVQNASLERFIAPTSLSSDPVASSLSLDVRLLEPEGDVYGVALELKMDAMFQEKLAWRAELTHAGFFSFPSTMSVDMIQGYLVTGCASFLLPFARRLLAELSPTLLSAPLSSIDFEALLDASHSSSSSPVPAPQETPLRFKLLKEELNELSFENPLTPQNFINRPDNLTPHMDVSVSAIAWPHQVDTFEVKLRVRIEGHHKAIKRYVCEVITSGIIECSSRSQEELNNILFLEVPSFLFPALRNKVALITQDSGLQTLLLHPLDFSSLQSSKDETKIAKTSLSSPQ